MGSNQNTLIIILGPTASGKTELAIKLAKEFNTEIISSDSRQFYKEMNIGTAKPSKKELDSVKHHLIGHLSVKEYYNVSMFESDVINILDKIFSTKDIAIMTGGSGLYIDVVCKGIDQLPDAEDELRKRIKNDFQNHGLEFLQKELFRFDPDFYKETDLSNPKRIIRALEVCQATGMKYSDLRKGNKKKRDFNILKIGLKLQREYLFERINHRVDKMMHSGLPEEAKSLYQFRHLNALNTVGYKELFSLFEGKYELKTAVEKIKTNTRRYAKRQITWFKRDPQIHWFNPKDYEEIRNLIRGNC